MSTQKHPTEWDAASYHRLADPQFEWGKKVLARLALRGDEVVVDAGCGSGRLTELIVERLPRGRVIAVDRSLNMLDEARRTLARFGERVRFVSADLAQLVLDERADVVFSTATFHWVLDHDVLFQRLYACLAPGGLLHAQCGGGPNLARIHARAEALLAEPPYRERFASFRPVWSFQDAQATRERLVRAGFVDVRTDLELAPTVIADPVRYRDFLRTVILRAHLSHIADDELSARFLDRMTELAAHDSPAYELDYVRLNLAAHRPA